MTKATFPWIALVIGLAMTLGLYFSGAMTTPDKTALPLLTVLFMSELGGVLSAAGAYAALGNWLADRSNTLQLLVAVVSAVLAIALIATGIALWQHNIPA